ncbi:hypothetical protein [Dactylosporangium sp. NPDC005555]|uniref:hypothetical protein n=1 Tax=Dactylosporangium sp. NPDC005555 TaxID=3154889 RepID=UPI0033A942C8
MFPFAMIVSQNAMAHEVRSAMPHAPVVAPAAPLIGGRPARTRQFRAALAAKLHAAGDAVAPAAACSPAS